MSNKPTQLTRKVSLFLYVPAITAVTVVTISLTNSIAVLWSVLLLGVILAIGFKTDVYLKTLTISAFFLRLIVIFADANLRFLPYRWDDYYHIAVAIKRNIMAGIPLFNGMVVSENTKAYSLFSSLQYLLFGDINLIVKISNAFFAILVILRIYQIGLTAFKDKKVAFWSALYFAFLPSYLLYSTLDMRDSLIILISVDIIYRVICNSGDQKNIRFLFLAVDLGLMFFLRPQNIGLYAIIGLVYFFFTHVLRRPVVYKYLVAGGAIVALVLFFYWLNHSGISKVILLRANAILSSRAVGGSAYLKGFHYHNWVDIFKALPLRFVYFTFGPLPWDIRNLFMFMSFLEVLFVSFFFVLTLHYCLVRDRFNDVQLLLIIFGLIGLAANSLFDSNYGTAIRHRLNYTFIFLMFGSASLQRARMTFRRII